MLSLSLIPLLTPLPPLPSNVASGNARGPVASSFHALDGRDGVHAGGRGRLGEGGFFGFGITE